MDKWRYFDITHAEHDVMNPSSPEKLIELGASIGLAHHDRVLDIGCGQGAMLIYWHQRFGTSGIGVEASPYTARRATQRMASAGYGDSIEIVHGRGEDFRSEERFDVTGCIGASWIFGGHAGTLSALAAFTKPGGAVVVGEPYWIEEPTSAYLEAEGIAADDFHDLGGCLDAALKNGLRLIWMARSTPTEWDRYEMLQAAAVDRFAQEHPDDPDLNDLLAMRRRADHAYVNWGHRCLGWALWAFRTSG